MAPKDINEFAISLKQTEHNVTSAKDFIENYIQTNHAERFYLDPETIANYLEDALLIAGYHVTEVNQVMNLNPNTAGLDTGARLLHEYSNNREFIKRLVTEQGVNINAKDKNGSTLLHSACELGSLDEAKTLLVLGAKPNIKDTNGLTAFHYLAECEINIEKTKDIRKTIPKDIRKTIPAEILRTIPEEIFKDIIDVLGSMIRNCHPSYNKDTHREAVDIFYSECLSAQDNYGNLPIHASIQKGGNICIFQLACIYKIQLLNEKNSEGYRPLDLSVMYCRATKHLSYLLKTEQINFNAIDENGQTLLHKAAAFGSFEEIHELDLEARDSDDSKHLITPSLSVIGRHIQQNHISANINAQDNEGNTPLHIAVKIGYVKSLLALKQFFNCDTEIRNHAGETPLDLAKRLYSIQDAQLPLENKTPMDLIIDALLIKNNPENDQTQDAQTPPQPDTGSEYHAMRSSDGDDYLDFMMLDSPFVSQDVSSAASFAPHQGYYPSQSECTHATSCPSLEREEEEIADNSDTENYGELRGSGKRKRPEKD